MIEDGRWERLLLHLLDECLTETDDETRAAREAVLLFSAVHARLKERPDT